MAESNRLRSYLRLALAEGVGPVLFRRLCDALGGVGAAASAPAGELKKVDGVGPKTAAAIAGVTDEQIDQELASAGKLSITILCLEDDDYPAALKTIYDPPPVLYIRGAIEESDAVAMAIVGSRHCTHYGMEQAERFGQLLGRAGFCVVSGGARGIDTAAHRGALAAGGRTVAVMGCGLAMSYPPENEKLFEQIVSLGRGAVVSELPMGVGVVGQNFPRRNRIISGLSLGTLIVEAARRSGALITGRDAAEQGREVFAVPGRVDSPLSAGTNDLIRSGATLVQGLDDILQQLGEVGAKLAPSEESGPSPTGLTEEEKQLFAHLQADPMSLDELVHATQWPTGKVVSALTMLVLKGAATQQSGNRFLRKKR